MNDGCTDSSSEILNKFPSIQRLDHPSNLGKGAALRTGIKHAQERGYSHVISMDSDGQHDSKDIFRFIESIHQYPNKLIIGVRNLKGAGRPLKSRLLRIHSNFWTWVETGVWVDDSQSGFRAYPLHYLKEFNPNTVKYDFEIEALVNLCWMGISVFPLTIAVRYHTGCQSHFRPIHDFFLVAKLNCRLISQRLFSFCRSNIKRNFSMTHWSDR